MIIKTTSLMVLLSLTGDVSMYRCTIAYDLYGANSQQSVVTRDFIFLNAVIGTEL